ncbi:hypothetical protein SAMN06265171_11260 [Chryseobacterium rhizoplanae]|uniref:Uncharacterized protein n=1 Tax=Chryseobacterium rhizoplanae TaxID=1609531 RepID=A0A521F791_9FLAO|nr:hypothetical protein SAMN06265171_11260 [Chryseobacterium rhizoplanae]
MMSYEFLNAKQRFYLKKVFLGSVILNEMKCSEESHIIVYY